MELYHGTNNQNAIEIESGQINVDLGGGELGKGFYIGDLPHEAYNWAWHQYKTEKSVVKLEIVDDDIINQNPLCLEYLETCRKRVYIKKTNTTRSFLFNTNIVWAPVVGKNIPNFNQLKIESKSAEAFVNGSSVIKTIL
jgi:hypothetical protein